MKRWSIVIITLCLCRFVYSQARLDYFMTEAAKCRMQQQWSKAFDMYRYCLDMDSDNAEALYQMGRMYFYLRQDSMGLEYLHRAVELDSSNTYYIEPLAAILLRQGCEEEALPMLERICELQSNRSDVLSHLSGIYAKTGRLEDAISTLDRLEILEGKMSQISSDKFSMYMQLGDSAKAFGELRSLCDEYPADLSYRINMGYAYQQLGYFDTALAIYDEVRRIDPTNPSLQLAMLDYYYDQGMDSIYTSSRDSILYDSDTDVDKKVLLLRQMVQRSSADSSDIKMITERFDRVLQTDTASVDLLGLYAAFLDYRQMPKAQIRSVLTRVLSVEPDNEMATQWLFQYYAGIQDYESLEEMCRRGINYHPEELMYSYFLAMILYERNLYDDALGVLDNGLGKRSAETRMALLSNTFTVRGDIYYKKKMYEKAFLDYDSALVYNRDNILCLNNYAYYLSLLDTQLDKAEEMSYRTIKAEPENKVYLDTYAWILFMQGSYGEAQKYMDMVVPRDSSDAFLLENEHTSANILEHAADIAWMNGEEERAVALWRLAVKRGDDVSPVLLKKAKKKKYIKNK